MKEKKAEYSASKVMLLAEKSIRAISITRLYISVVHL